MMLRLAFYKGTRPFPEGLFNIGVRWWTGGPYSHCEIIFNDDLSASSSFLDGGVRFKDIDYDPRKWDIIELTGFDHMKAYTWFINHLAEKYDVLNLLGFIWRRKDGSKKRWTCSESCAAALGLTEPWRYDPNSLYAIIKSLDGAYARNAKP